MFVQKSWRKSDSIPNARGKGDAYRVTHIYTGWFLFGILPLWVIRDSTWYVN